MEKFNKDKFKFHELCTNNTGKNSGSGFIGVILGVTAVIMIAAGTFGYFFDLPNTLEYLGIGLKVIAASTILLGVRKVSGRFGKDDSSVDPLAPPEVKPDEKG